jgi:hypothetical protein
VLLAAALSSARAHGWQASPEDHAKHHPGAQAAEQAAPVPQATSMAGMNMMAPNPKLDELVKKMNAAQGQAKVDAMAELLTAMVQEHQSMHANMSGMMSMMHKMGAAGGHEDAKK